MHRKLNRKIWKIFNHRFLISNRQSVIGNFFAGFTLTETVMASALLIVAIVPLLRALTSAHLNTGIIERKTRSLILAQAKLDEIKARSIYHYDNKFEEKDLSLDDSYLCNITDVFKSNNLRTITVLVGCDLNSDNVLADDEILVTLKTLLARRW